MNQDKMWEAYQNEPALQDMGCRDGGRIEFIAKHVPTNGRVLTIGVGRATLERLLMDLGVDIHCLDPSETSIEKIKQTLGLGDKAKKGYSQKIPFPESYFDCVVMTEVLEHLSDEVLWETRGEVYRVLVSGGQFIGSVPADENLVQSIVVCPNCGDQFHRWGHMQSFSKQGIYEFLSEGFKVVRVKRVIFADWASLNWKGRLAAMAKKLQAKMGKKGTGQNFFFCATKGK